jgi:nitrite reductase/ring-hydroxylating ferredoxin subunit
MAKRYIVGRASEYPPGSRRIVELGGRSVGVFNVDGKFYALRNVCPHRGAELCKGYVSHAVSSSTPGAYEWDGSTPILRCPWHGWEFDMRTGESWLDPARVKVRGYPVHVESERPPPAESYRVEQDDEVIVVEIRR